MRNRRLLRINLKQTRSAWKDIEHSQRGHRGQRSKTPGVFKWFEVPTDATSEESVEYPLSSFQREVVEAAAPSGALSDLSSMYVNPDTWSEDDEHVMMVNGYLYQSPQVEGERRALLQIAARRVREHRKQRLEKEKKSNATLKEHNMPEIVVQTFAGRPVFGELNILDATGHSKKTWDSHNPIEVEDARKSFNELRAKGFCAYTVNKDGKEGQIITEFDPNSEAVILMSPAPRAG